MGKKYLLVLILLSSLSVSGLYALHFDYNEDLSLVSDTTLALAMASPGLVLLEAPVSDYLTIGGSYGVTMAATYFGIRTPLKALIDKERPYVGETTERPVDTDEDYDSFPSGHSLMAFAAAAYTQTITSIWYPDSKIMQGASIAGWSLATATAVLRVVSGNHYPIDVLAGAALGSAVGFLGPYLTSKLFPPDGSVQILAGPVVGMQVAF
ncbi:MAG: phosphatase PAP2 family protein [Sphaerochaeta sp.]